MNHKLLSILSLFLCAVLLSACAGQKHNEAPVEQPPVTESPATGESSAGEIPTGTVQNGDALSADALAEYTDWFMTINYNGLLRFPYSDGADSSQIAPYLDLLFYDMGDTDISDEEYALLEEAGMFLELDEFRLSRAFVIDYLVTTLAMPQDQAELLLSETENLFGIYLPETDAWYMCHGDTAWMSYTFDRGEYFPDSETVKLYYTNPFLTVLLPDGEIDFLTDQPMVVTLSIEGGERYVLANEFLSQTW